MRSILDIVENAKPMRLTITHDVSATAGMFVSALADECGISEDAVAQRLYDFAVAYLGSIVSGNPATLGHCAGDLLASIFPETAGGTGLIALARSMNPEIEEALSTPFGGDSFDFRKFLKVTP